MLGFEFWVLGVGFRVWGFGFGIGFRFCWVFGCWMFGFWMRVFSLVFFGVEFRALGVGLWVSDLGVRFWMLVDGFWVWFGFGFLGF